MPSRYGYALRANLAQRVEAGSTVYTDDWTGYKASTAATPTTRSITRDGRTRTATSTLRPSRGSSPVQERRPGRLPLRVREVGPGLLERVHLALQPPRQRPYDVRRARGVRESSSLALLRASNLLEEREHAFPRGHRDFVALRGDLLRLVFRRLLHGPLHSCEVTRATQHRRRSDRVRICTLGHIDMCNNRI